ncbi:expressed protein [Chlorella variabilis]|uniref:Expressed protein n=1 Tax=Chlorella variabilis TaxID=554065 RepID=E1Z4M4_CHLVA|nr:expressed protein [Chlorella variabilis]EFN59372.1 expressed protein [Chlorella variabilis]|eukprot:XP_005851474.1 expressed protein [Chlorella variabilis]
MMPAVVARGPLFDYECAAECLSQDGWDPVCVHNGRDPGVEGTLFPNECALKCTSNTDASTPHYTYLPFDDQICSSAVGCSLLGQAVDRCRELWETPEEEMSESPKLSDDCGCEWIPSKAAGGPAGAPSPAPGPTPDDLVAPAPDAERRR